MGDRRRDQQFGSERQSVHGHTGLLHVEVLESLRLRQGPVPAVTLTSAPTFGTGTSGASELEEFFKRGLLDMDVVVALNVYSNPALSSYATVIDKYAARLAGKRIWVTETGSSNPANQIAWVQEFYPRLLNTVHPEMICWYALWGGAGVASDNGFGLLDQVESGHAVERPLFTALVGQP